MGKFKWRWLKQRYGLSKEDFLLMFDSQKGLCGICEIALDSSTKNQKPHVDHCHSTKVVRGLLYNNCNVFIAFAKHDIRNLDKARGYLTGTLS